MEISATDYTIALILEPRIARKLRDILIGHPVTRNNDPELERLYKALDEFVDGENE